MERQATQRIGASTPLRIVDAIVTGTHEPGSSHHELLRAFVGDRVLADATRALERDGFRTHEFGDSMLVFADARSRLRRDSVPASAACAA
jgi:S-adenosylmethionine:tRNA ribosyltransferase-isomerase